MANPENQLPVKEKSKIVESITRRVNADKSVPDDQKPAKIKSELEDHWNNTFGQQREKAQQKLQEQSDQDFKEAGGTMAPAVTELKTHLAQMTNTWGPPKAWTLISVKAKTIYDQMAKFREAGQ